MEDDTIVIRKRPLKNTTLRSQQAINQAQRAGLAIDEKKKFNAATNKHASTSLNSAKLDRETEELHHNTVGADVGRLIQQGRQKLSLTQKDLATKICEKVQIVTEYESGKAIPNQQVLAKMERALGVKLRGKDKGQPLGGDKKK